MNNEKNIGKASIACRRILWKSVIILFALLTGGFLAMCIGNLVMAVAGFVCFLWIALAVFILYFFRDPSPRVPTEPGIIVSPGHGTVDFIGEATELDYLGFAPCKRISIFLSIFNVHVQNAPVTGRVVYMKYTEGRFINAMNLESAATNENLLFGFETPDSRKVSVRLIAGLIARRVVPWVREGEMTEQGERISIIQFGSRVDIYFPMEASIQVHLGDKVRGGETILAKW